MSKKILLLSTWDNQGSGTALYKISKFLLENGHEVVLAVRDKSRTDSFVVQIPLQRNIIQKVFNRVLYQFNFGLKPLTHKFIDKTNPKYSFLNIDEKETLVSSDTLIDVIPFTPDLIVTGLISGFVNTTILAELKEKTKAEIYMLTVDMACLTGGCHYAWDCKGYQLNCKNCPAILDHSYKDRAHQNLMVKQKNVEKANIKVIAGSGWTLNQAKLSTLFKSQKKIYNINSCIDNCLFNDKHRRYAKRIFNLPDDAKVIFTGSAFTHDKRKGVSYFVEALKYLWEAVNEETKKNTLIMIAGNHTIKNELIEQIPFQKRLIDYIKDERLLSLAYQASDIFVCSSVEDSGPMMVSEALACGTPVVGFEMGVTSNMVINGFNGYKAELKNSEDLGKGISEILSLPKEKYEEYSRNAIYQVEEYSSQEVVVNIINRILNENQ